MSYGKRCGHLSTVMCLIVALFITIMFFHPLVDNTLASMRNNFTTPRSPLPDAPLMINRTAEIENILLSIDEGLMAKYIQKLQDYKTRYAYRVDKCFQASEYIYSVFERNGLDVSYDPFTYNGYSMRNVIGEKPGASTSDSIFIICAHYDSISGTNPSSTAPGADDNGSGTAAVMAAADVLSDYEFNYTIRFIAFSGEEQGLRGSYHYVTNAMAAGDNITGAINLDMVAYTPAVGSKILIANMNGHPQCEELVIYTNQTAEKYGQIINITVSKGGISSNSDHSSFGPQYKGIHLFEVVFNPYYHSLGDTIDKLNMTYCANATQIAIATIAELAELNSTDIMPPVHTPGFPPPNGYGNATPTISIEATDPSPLNQSSIEMLVNGIPITQSLIPVPLGYNISFQQPTPFTDGQIINVSILVNDTLGNGFNYSWEFTVDAIAPASPTDLISFFTRIEATKRGLVLDIGESEEPDSTHVFSPSVIFHDGEYKMWYTGHNGTHFHIIYANSSDGLNWSKHGVVLCHGAPGEPDDLHTSYPSVLFDGEYKMWYSGHNGTGWRIMYANSSDGIDWVKQGVAVDLGAPGELDCLYTLRPTVIKTTEYEMWYTGRDGLLSYHVLYANSTDGMVWSKYKKEITPVNPSNPFGDADIPYPVVVYHNQTYHMWYNRNTGNRYRTMYAVSSDGLKWNDHGLAINTGPLGDPDFLLASLCSVIITEVEIKIWYSGFDSKWHILYANITNTDNLTELVASWAPSTSDDVSYYEICRANKISDLYPWQTYMSLNQSSFAENRLGDENSSNYYYRIRAVDKVRHTAECDKIIGKIGTNMASGWSLIANPLLEGDTPITDALSTARWDCARAYDIYDMADPWKTNIIGRPETLNTLVTLNQTMGVWTHVGLAEVYVSTGIVENISLTMHAGWNLIAYPYHEQKTVSEALVALPWDKAEGFDPGAAYHLVELNGSDIMQPGGGYWIHLTSAAVWNAINL